VKRCPTCCETKPFSEFHKHRGSKDGFCWRCKSCRKTHRNLELDAETNKQWRKRNPKQVLVLNAAARARRKGIEFSITENDFEIPTMCPVLGIPLSSTNKRHDGSPTLDRIINDRGYVPGNVTIISWRANRIKSDATLAELQAIVAFYNTIQDNTHADHDRNG
jgi:hypothetical protein